MKASRKAEVNTRSSRDYLVEASEELEFIADFEIPRLKDRRESYPIWLEGKSVSDIDSYVAFDTDFIETVKTVEQITKKITGLKLNKTAMGLCEKLLEISERIHTSALSIDVNKLQTKSYCLRRYNLITACEGLIQIVTVQLSRMEAQSKKRASINTEIYRGQWMGDSLC